MVKASNWLPARLLTIRFAKKIGQRISQRQKTRAILLTFKTCIKTVF